MIAVPILDPVTIPVVAPTEATAPVQLHIPEPTASLNVTVRVWQILVSLL
jgi:hypothetical protein